MTILTLSGRLGHQSRRAPFGAAAFGQLSILARERVLTRILLLGIVMSLAFYIGAMYVMFGIESVVKKQEERIEALSRETDEFDYAFRERIVSIPETHKEFLSSFERVSSIRYIGGAEGYAAARGVTVP